jgi:transposase
MDLLHPLCAGLDVHKDTVVACVRRVIDNKVKREVRTFGTTTGELLALSDWLTSQTSPWRRPACTGSRSGTS